MPAGIMIGACTTYEGSRSYTAEPGKQQLMNGFNNFNLNICASGSPLFSEKRKKNSIYLTTTVLWRDIN